MLVLTRRLHESIVLPDLDITVEVTAIEGGKVRLGISAPRSVAILRGELADQPLASAPTGTPVTASR